MTAAPTQTAALRPPATTEVVFRELLRTLGDVQRVMAPYFAQFGISGAQWGVLRNLHRAQKGDALPGLRLTDLSQRLLIRPPSVMGVIDRLQRAGLVARMDSPSDQRAKYVTLTDAGWDLVERVLMVHARQIEGVMAGLTADEQEQLHSLLLRLRAGMEAR
jgi:DNA-binding MarR family transcriptional regulator